MTGAWLRGRSHQLVIPVLGAICCALEPLQSRAAPFAYIPNAGDASVSIIDTATNTLAAAVAVGRAPQGVAVRPDGRRVYVSNFDDGTVSVIDASTNTVVATVSVLPLPLWVTAAPDGSVVYIAHVTRPGYVTVLDAGTNRVIDTVEVGNSLAGIAPSRDGERLYVAGTFLDQERRPCTLPSPLVLYCDIPLYVVGMAPPRHTLSSRAIGDYLTGVAVSPDGHTVYVADQEAEITGSSYGRVTLLDATVLPNAIRARIRFGGADVPAVFAVSPEGTRVYVGGHAIVGGDASVGGMVWVIDPVAQAVVASIPFTDSVTGLSLTPDGSRLYVVQYRGSNDSPNGMVHAVDTGSNAIEATLPVGLTPFAWGQFIRPPVRCAGDCDGDGEVGIGELISGVNIAVGRAAVDTCMACDLNGDDVITVADLVRAIGSALNGCPFPQPAAALRGALTARP
jgi:YVTN family beta-propeller protein